MEPEAYGATGAWQAGPPAADPVAEPAWRRARLASLLQLASPFVFTATLLAGLVWEIPTARDPHGYGQIFGFLGSVVLLLVVVILAALAAGLVRRRSEGGAVLVAVLACVAAVESLGLATGFPSGIGALVPVRVLTILVGVVWLAVSVWCVVAAVRTVSAVRD